MRQASPPPGDHRAVAHVQVARSVRRPGRSDVFVAVEVHEDRHVLRMCGSWRGSAELRTYTLPLRSIVAIRHLETAT